MHVAVVQELVNVGKLEKGKTFSRNIHIKSPLQIGSGHARLIVFGQEPEPGKVVGVALQISSIASTKWRLRFYPPAAGKTVRLCK